MRWAIASLLVLTAWMSFILYIALPLPSGKLFGSFFLVIGALNLFSFKRLGREFYGNAVRSSFRR